jgi:uncharacterized protein
MSKDKLPIQVDPIRLAENAADLHGKLPVEKMPRLCTSLLSPSGEVEVHVKFGVDRQGIRNIEGHVKAELTLECQRCLEPFMYEVVSDFTYGMINAEDDAKALPASYDPVLVKDGSLNIQDMIEEELIVNLPIVPMHDEQDCKIHLPLFVASDKEVLPMAEKESPFKIIESLKVKKPKQE